MAIRARDFGGTEKRSCIHGTIWHKRLHRDIQCDGSTVIDISICFGGKLTIVKGLEDEVIIVQQQADRSSSMKASEEELGEERVMAEETGDAYQNAR